MPYTYLTPTSSTVNLQIGDTGATVFIDCSRVLHPVTRIEVQNICMGTVTNTGMYTATTSLFRNMSFGAGIIPAVNRSQNDGDVIFVYQNPTYVNQLHSIDYVFLSPITVAGTFNVTCSLIFFSDPDGRYI